jgi:hypothetical protein
MAGWDTNGSGNLDLESSHFVIKFCYESKQEKGAPVEVGDEQKFSLKELADQDVHDKTIIYKNYETKQFLAQLAFRSQLVYDYAKLVERIRKKIETKVEAVEMSMTMQAQRHPDMGSHLETYDAHGASALGDIHKTNSYFGDRSVLAGEGTSIIGNNHEFYVT